DPLPSVMAGCVGLWYPGNEGAAKVLDYSGYNNIGTVTGATLSRGVTLPARDVVTPYRPRVRAVTSTTPVSQTIAPAYEALQSLAPTSAFSFEALQALVSGNPLGYEVLAGLAGAL